MGVNIYSVIYENANPNTPSKETSPIKLMDYVYENFADRKPIHISEWATNHYTTADNSYYIDFAKERIQELYQGIKTDMNRVGAIHYFSVNAITDAQAAPEDRQTRDYSLTDNKDILSTYQEVVSNDFYKNNIYDNTVNVVIGEKEIDTDNNLIIHKDKAYLPVRELMEQKNLKVIYNQANHEVEIRGEHEADIAVSEHVMHDNSLYIEKQDFDKLIEGLDIELADSPIYQGEKNLHGIQIEENTITDIPYFTVYKKTSKKAAIFKCADELRNKLYIMYLYRVKNIQI